MSTPDQDNEAGAVDPLELWQRDMAAALEMIASTRMPFGKYGPQLCPPNGVPLYDIPVEYLLWFRQKGFPKSTLGRLLAIVCQIKVDGSDAVFEPFRRRAGGRTPLRPPRRKTWDFTGEELPLEHGQPVKSTPLVSRPQPPRPGK